MGWKEGLWSVSMRCVWFLRIYSLSSSLNVVSAGTPMRPPSSSELSSSSGAKRRTDLRPVFEDEDATLDAEDGPVSEGFVGELGLDMARWGGEGVRVRDEERWERCTRQEQASYFRP